MSAHTPGPWMVGDLSRGVMTKRGLSVAEPPESDGPADDAAWDADAQLIAAAPDLYDALGEVLAAHQRMDPHHEDVCSVCRLAVAALAKARGKS